jgi:hypothetical protein
MKSFKEYISESTKTFTDFDEWKTAVTKKGVKISISGGAASTSDRIWEAVFKGQTVGTFSEEDGDGWAKQ